MEAFYSEVIGSRSFASVWYWIVFALIWTRTTHWTLGVPYEDARMAQRLGGQHQIDFETMIDINTRKTVAMFAEYNVIMTALATFLLATIFMLGFYFNIQFMQAGFLLLFPLSVIGVMSVRFAFRLAGDPLTGKPLFKAYVFHRRLKQIIGGVAILIATFWGVSQTLFSPFA